MQRSTYKFVLIVGLHLVQGLGSGGSEKGKNCMWPILPLKIFEEGNINLTCRLMSFVTENN